MFTGIIQAVGRITAIEPRGGDQRLGVATGTLPVGDLALGDSVAVSGVCLTVISRSAHGFEADVSRETLARTIIGRLRPGDPVNLELALTPTSRLGGHIVSGHVDGIGAIAGRTEDARSVRFRIAVPAGLAKYIAEKGSICVDGISLTVNAVGPDWCEVNIVPHTLAVTTLGSAMPGREVNLEVDLLARYLERLLTGTEAAATPPAGLTHETLTRAGFVQGTHEHD
jgi:riboflavin synthase